jgi:hypothetical protein
MNDDVRKEQKSGLPRHRKGATPDAENTTKLLLDADLATTIEAEGRIHRPPHPEIKG